MRSSSLICLLALGTAEQRSIPNLHRGGDRLPTLNGQSEPFHSELVKSPKVGFERTTSQLTSDRSTTKLLRNNGKFELIEFNSHSQPMTIMS
ncbi:hypothetical protein Lal_00031510 [Lupinus albus]|nr:hypothetical protein Lal_00031510 [Lupinus albus]